MAQPKQPIVIKKYANRRLYNTGTSTYVTLEDLAQMVKSGAEFTVTDAKSGEDITRSVLTQIIFEQENKGQNLLPITFLRQLIRFYGDSLQGLVPSYLDMSMRSFSEEQGRFRDQMSTTFGTPYGKFEDQVRQNMAMFERAFRMFSPFQAEGGAAVAEATPAGGEAAARGEGELDGLRRQMAEMQKQLDEITRKR